MTDPIRIVPCGLVAGDGSHLKVKLDVIKGRRAAEVRVHDASGPGKILMPTKTGVPVRIEHLGALIAALQDAQREALEAGWLEGGGA